MGGEVAENVRPKDKIWTWAALGFPDETVRQIKVAGEAGVKLEDPPDHLVERTINACLQAVREQREEIRKERTARSVFWRFWYWVTNWLKGNVEP